MKPRSTAHRLPSTSIFMSAIFAIQQEVIEAIASTTVTRLSVHDQGSDATAHASRSAHRKRTITGIVRQLDVIGEPVTDSLPSRAMFRRSSSASSRTRLEAVHPSRSGPPTSAEQGIGPDVGADVDEAVTGLRYRSRKSVWSVSKWSPKYTILDVDPNSNSSRFSWFRHRFEFDWCEPTRFRTCQATDRATSGQRRQRSFGGPRRRR